MTVEEIINSKTYVNPSNITFNSPKEYIKPFIDITGEDNIDVIGSDAVINKNEDGSENISYARVRIQKSYNSSELNNIGIFSPVVGLIYALDISKPVMKVYAGLNAVACNNLNVFNAEHLFQVDIIGNITTAYKYVKEYQSSIEQLIEDYYQKIEIMNNKMLTKEEYSNILGGLLRRSVNDNVLGTTPIVKMTKLLEDKRSDYYFYKEGNNNLWNIYNAATDYISSSPEYKEHPNKSLKMFNLITGVSNVRKTS